MTREKNLDLLRAIGAVAVVLLHAPPFYHSNVLVLKAFGWGIRELCQVAVPMFFLISGYLAGRRHPELPGGTRALKRILTLYLPWFGFYLAVDLLMGNATTEWTVVLRRLLGFSVEGEPTNGYHLWFLPAMLWGFLLLRGSLAAFRSAWPAFVGGVALYLGVGWATFPDRDLPWLVVPHEGVSLSLLFLATGYLVGQKRTEGSGVESFQVPGWSIPLAALWLLLEAGFLGWIAGKPWIVPAFQPGRVILPWLLLVVAVSSPEWRLPRRLAPLAGGLATASTGIYVMHLAVLELIPFEDLIQSGFLRDNFVRWPVAIIVPAITALLALKYGPKRIRSVVS